MIARQIVDSAWSSAQAETFPFNFAVLNTERI